MKTKQVRLKFDQIKAGVVGYVAHPMYGIRRVVFKGRPYFKDHTPNVPPSRPSWWVDTECEHGLKDYSSICDMGIPAPHTNFLTPFYNDRRTFRKLKHAEEWCRKWKNDPGFIARHAKHERSFEDDWMWDLDADAYYDEYDDQQLREQHEAREPVLNEALLNAELEHASQEGE